MDHTHLMIEFINGELNPDLEREFFYNLSVSDEFRSRFKQLLSIERTIGNNIEITAPSPELTGKVFSNLGFSYIPAPSGVPAASNPKPGFMARHGGRIMTGLFSSLFTAAVMLLIFLPYMNHESGNARDNKIFATGPGNITSSGNAVQNNQPGIVNAGKDKPSIAKNRMISEGSIGKSNDSNRPGQTQSGKGIEFTSNSGRVPALADTIERLIPVHLRSVYDANVVYSPIQIVNTDFNLSLNETENKETVNELGFIIEVRGTEAWMLPSSTFPRAQSPKFLDKGLTLFYTLPKDYHLGIDIRHEDFFLKYRGVENQDYNFNYEQQSSFTSLGLVLRKPLFSINNFQPFGQLYLGGNYYGFVGRFMAGVNYSPTSELSFMAGLEYSNMLFVHQGTLFSASKLGLNYGLLLRF